MEGKANMKKRVYSAMSTSEFVSIAISIHGDKFDYSGSFYTGSQEPFSFKCNKCGCACRLSQAQTHIRKNKPCGCRRCNKERLCSCVKCGDLVSSRVFYLQGRSCVKCVEKRESEKANLASSKHGKNCKTCGKWFVHRDRFYCSKECREFKPKRASLKTCNHCGVEFLREYSREKAQRLNFCSVRCQNEFQRNNYFDYHPNARRSDLKKNSGRVRSRWYRERSAERRSRSIAFAWWKKCKDSVAVLHVSTVAPWDRRISSAARLLRTRADPTFKLDRVKIYTWESALKNAMASTRLGCRKEEKKKWSKKINNVVKNLKKRFEVKSKRNTGSYGGSTVEILRESLLNAE